MKLLIIKLGALGDVVMAMPFIQQLVTDYSSDELWLLTTPSYAELFRNWKTLNVYAIPRQGVMATINTIRWLRRQHFDRVYDLQSNDRTGWWCALSGIPIRVGNHPRFPYTIHPRDSYTGQCHAFERWQQVLESAGHHVTHPLPSLPCADETKAAVSHWLREHKLDDRPFFVMHAGANARHSQKRWPHFLQLATTLNQQGFGIVWVGAEDDAILNEELAKHVGINATSRFSIVALAELGRHARCAITNDSAPMHILSCANIPVFGIFGPTDWRRTHAIGQRERVITLDYARNRTSCTMEARQLGNISPAFVFDKLRAHAIL